MIVTCVNGALLHVLFYGLQGGGIANSAEHLLHFPLSKGINSTNNL